MRKKLGEVLREAGLIDELQLEAALTHQRSFGGHLGRILIDNGFLTELQLVETLSRILGVPRVELARRDVPAELLAYVPLDFAEKFLAVPVALRAEQKGEQLILAMSDPTNLEAVDTLQFKTGKRVVPMIAAESEVEGAIRRWYYGEKPREIAPRSLDHVQFPGREVETKPADLDEIPVVTGATLIEPPAAETPAPLSGDWFLQLDAQPPSAAAPVAPAMVPAAPAPATQTPSPSSPFTAAPAPVAPPTTTQVPSSPFTAAPGAPATIRQPTSSPFAAAPSSREELFGAPNSFLGRDDETGLGQTDPREPPDEEPLPLPDDALMPLPDDSLTPLPDVAVTPLPPSPTPTPTPAAAPPQQQDPFAPPQEQDPFAPTPPPPQQDPFAPASSGALPVAKARADDDDDASAAELKPVEPPAPIEPLTLDDDDDTPIELATAADFLHGGPPEAAVERGLDLDDDEDVPLELATAAEMISVADPSPAAPPDPTPSGDDDAMLLATAAELAQMSLGPETPAAPSSDGSAPVDGEPPRMPGFEDLSELTDLALARLSHIGAPGLDPDVTADLDVGDAGYSALAEARARALEEATAASRLPSEPALALDVAAPQDAPAAPAPGERAPPREPSPWSAQQAEADADATLRPLPPPGGVVPDDGDDDGDAPIEVVNMPPDRRPVEFAAIPAAPKPSPDVQDDFGNPLDAGGNFDGEMEALDIEGSVFDSDSGEVPAAPVSPSSLSTEPPPLGDADDVEITEDIEVDVATPPAPLLSAHAIHELERLGHDGTTTLSHAGVVDTPERVAGGEAPGEVMTLALPTPAFSRASMVDAPWRLAGETPPLGRGPTDVPLAPFGLSSSSFAVVDDVASLAPPALLARLAELGDAAVALPGAAAPPPLAGSIEAARAEGFGLPDTVPITAPDDDDGAGLADAWREAAERQLLHRSHSDDLVVPERRRALEAPAPTPALEAPRPLHAYAPSSPAEPPSRERPPWAILVDAATPGAPAANGDADEEPVEAADEPPPPAPVLAEELLDVTADAMPLPDLDWAAALDDAPAPPPAPPPSPSPAPPTTTSSPSAGLPAATPRSVLIADVVQMDDDLTPESSPPQATPSAPPKGVPGGVSFAPTPTMITRMSPEELRALAERLVQRGALTSDDIDAARKAKEAAELDDDG